MKPILRFLIAWAILSIFTVWALAIPVHAEESFSLPASVLSGSLLLAPAPFTGNGMTMMLGWEHEGLTYMATDLGYRVLPKDFGWVSPVGIWIICALYHIGEMNDPVSTDLAKRKLAIDSFGVLGRVSVNVFNF